MYKYNQGDKVRYVGSRFAEEFKKKKLGNGEIQSRVNQPDNPVHKYTVTFTRPDGEEESFILSECFLVPAPIVETKAA